MGLVVRTSCDRMASSVAPSSVDPSVSDGRMNDELAKILKETIAAQSK
jgi:hypothetical protein